MDHFREIKNHLTWHNEGKFEAEVINGVIKKLNFCEPGKGPDDTGKCLTSTNYKYLQAVHSCLGELFNFIEEENKRLGYKYADHIPAPTYQPTETNDSQQLLQAKLRPLINYEQSADDKKDDAIEHDIELTA